MQLQILYVYLWNLQCQSFFEAWILLECAESQSSSYLFKPCRSLQLQRTFVTIVPNAGLDASRHLAETHYACRVCRGAIDALALHVRSPDELTRPVEDLVDSVRAA